MEAVHFQGCLQRVGDAPSPTWRRHLWRGSFLPLKNRGCGRRLRLESSTLRFSAAAAAGEQSASVEEVLPDKLGKIVRLFEAVADQRAKYEQLMHYAKRLKPLGEEYHTKEYKVEGCVSQVWVRAYLGADSKVYFEADSDSILTKGLAALLVEGLSGASSEEILRLTPDFIQMLGLKQSLTPSRSNGFYNMFRLMQKKTLELHMDSSGSSNKTAPDTAKTSEIVESESPAAPITSAMPEKKVEGPSSQVTTRQSKIQQKLREALSPSVLEIEDVSHQHAGHAGVRGVTGGETHFNVKVVSSEFEGRSLVKRHRLIYDLLQDELNSGLHALSIVAKTPSEVGSS